MKANKKNFILYVTIIFMFINCFTFLPETILYANDKIVINEVHFESFDYDKYKEHFEGTFEFIEGESSYLDLAYKFKLIDKNYPDIKVNTFKIQRYFNNDWKNARAEFTNYPHRYFMIVQCYDASYVLTENTKVYINDIEYSSGKIKELITAKDGKTMLMLSTKPKTPLKKVYPPYGLSYDYNGSEIVGVKENEGYKLIGNIERNAGKYTAIATLLEGYIWNDKTKNERSVLWEIKKAKVQQAPIQDKELEAYQNDKLSSVILGNEWQWLNPETIINEQGEQKFKAVYAPNGEFNNYETYEVVLTVNVKAKTKIEVPQAIDGLVYNKETQIGVAEGTGYTLTNNTAANAGEYTATAKLNEGYVWDDNTNEDKEIAWSISKAAGSDEEGYVIPENLEATQGDKLQSVILPEQWTWTDSSVELNEIGKHDFQAKYTPKDSQNYEELIINVQVKVNKKPDIQVTIPIAKTGLVYTGEELTGVETSEGYTLSGNTSTNAGEYTATAKLNEGYVWDDGSYEAKTIQWSIAKAAGSDEEGYAIPENLEATQGQKLSDVTLPEHWLWVNPETSLDIIGKYEFQAKYTPLDTQNYKEVINNITIKVIKAKVIPGNEEDDDKIDDYYRNDDNHIHYHRPRNNSNRERIIKERKLAEEKALQEKKAAEAQKEKELASRRLILNIGSTIVNKFGKNIENDVAPIIKNQRTMLPARLVAESLGAIVEWNPVSRTVIIIGKNIKTNELVDIVLTIDSNIALVNGVQTVLDSKVFIENRRTYTPVRFIAELLGAEVEWDGFNNKVIIIK